MNWFGAFTRFVVALLLISPLAARAAKFHVSPQGSDAWSGALAEPNAARTDGPFATLTKARDAVRQWRATKQPAEPVKVLVRGGRYELGEPVVFTPADSGTAASPTIFAAFPGEKPVMSGGRKITGWKTGARGAWTADLPEARNGIWLFRHVSVNGEFRHRPRLPREGHYIIAGFAGADPKAKYNTPADRFEFAPGDIHADWRNLHEVEAVVLHYWVDAHLRIASVDTVARVAAFDRFSRRKLTDDSRPTGARYYVENVFEALAPGEFYFDRAAGRLHYWPRPGETPENTELVVPGLSALVELKGDPAAGKFVEHVEFADITFRDAAWEPLPKDAADVQAAGSVSGAIIATGARRCAFTDCRLQNLGGYGLELRDGCRGNRVTGCELAWLGAGGLKLNGGTAQSPEAQRNAENVITDNHLHHLGRLFHSGVGILAMHSASNTIAHNLIHDLYYTGISVGWIWGYAPSVSRDNKIEFNHIHTIGQKLLSDMGGIYLLGRQPGTVVRGNVIHDVDSWSYGGWGIYTDEGSSEILIENNLVYRTKSGGFHQHYGHENVVRNNIFALAREEQIARSRAEPHLSFTFERNIVFYRTGTLFGHNWKDDKFALNSNLYWNAAGKPPQFPSGDFASWQARGFDRNSLVADPLFRDPDHGDFTLAPNSPALKLGFQPPDWHGVGPRKNP